MNDLNALQSMPSVAKATEQLRSLSSGRPIEFFHTCDWVPSGPNDPKTLHSAAYVRSDDKDRIYVSETLPEHMAVHELLHASLSAR